MNKQEFYKTFAVSEHLRETLEGIARIHQARTEHERQKALSVAKAAVSRAKAELFTVEEDVCCG